MFSMDQTDRDYPGCVCDDGIFAAGGIPFLYRFCGGACALSPAEMVRAKASRKTGAGGFSGAVCGDLHGAFVYIWAGVSLVLLRQLCWKVRAAGDDVLTGACCLEYMLRPCA